jgi:hypothetical protein
MEPRGDGSDMSGADQFFAIQSRSRRLQDSWITWIYSPSPRLAARSAIEDSRDIDLNQT